MGELARVWVSVRAQLDGLRRDMPRVQGMLGGMLSRVGGPAGMIAKGIMGGFKFAFNSVLGLAKSFAGMLFKLITAPLKMLSMGGMLGGLAGGIGAFFIGKEVAGFQEEMQKSLAIMSDKDGMEAALVEQARTIAKQLGMSHEEAARSYFYLASAGLDAAKSLKAMPVVAQFAKAGSFDMALATDMLTDSLSALGKASKDPIKYQRELLKLSDQMVKGNILANTSVEQLAEAMTNTAAASMKSVGLETEDGIAALLAFADQGTKGAEAGTQFSMVLRDLQTQALKNKEAFKSAGVSVFDAGGEFRDIASIIGDLETTLSGLSDEARKQKLLNLGFIDRSVKAIVALMGTSKNIAKYREELRDAGGETARIAKENMGTLLNRFRQLKVSIIDAGISLGNKLMPYLERFVDWVRQGVDSVGSLIEKMEMTSTLDKWAKSLKEIWQNFAILREHMAGAGKTFTSTIVQGITELLDKLSLLSQEWDKTWELMKVTTALAFEYIKDYARMAMQQLLGAVGDAMGKIELRMSNLGRIVARSVVDPAGAAIEMGQAVNDFARPGKPITPGKSPEAERLREERDKILGGMEKERQDRQKDRIDELIESIKNKALSTLAEFPDKYREALAGTSEDGNEADAIDGSTSEEKKGKGGMTSLDSWWKELQAGLFGDKDKALNENTEELGKLNDTLKGGAGKPTEPAGPKGPVIHRPLNAWKDPGFSSSELRDDPFVEPEVPVGPFEAGLLPENPFEDYAGPDTAALDRFTGQMNQGQSVQQYDANNRPIRKPGDVTGYSLPTTPVDTAFGGLAATATARENDELLKETQASRRAEEKMAGLLETLVARTKSKKTDGVFNDRGYN